MQSLNEPDLLFYSNSDQTTRDILDNNRLNNDQIQTNQKELPNIILIILESHTASRCNFLNPDLKESITPVLDDIAHNSINFRNCYANGTRSAYGLSSIYCSWPVIPGYPLNRQQQYKIKGQTKFVLSKAIELSLTMRYSALCFFAIESVLIKKTSRFGWSAIEA